MPPNLANPVLLSEVEELRSRFPETQALYREVCTLLFFRHGITPTANKLYQLVRKGSMSAPAEALSRFWENLRVKSRVRIEHPDLPPELADAAGGLLGTLWQRARENAQASYETDRDESRRALAQAEAHAQSSEARAEAAAQALFQLRAEFSAALTRFQELEQALEQERGHAAALERALAAAQLQLGASEAALAQLRAAHAQMGEAHKAQLRDQRNALEAQHREELARAEAAGQREREAAQEWQRALERLRRDTQEQAREEAARAVHSHEENAALRAALSAAQAQLAEARATRELLRHQLDRALFVGKAPAARRGRIQRYA